MRFFRSLRAHILHHGKHEDTPYLAAGAVLSVILVGTFVLFGSSIAERVAYTYGNVAAVISAALVDMANTDRTASGVRSLTISPLLTAAAQAKADDMAAKGYFAHFDAAGKGPWDWMHELGYQYRYAGENLAIQFSDSGDVERAWLNSPAHRQNLLDDRFTEVGIAVAQGMYQGQPTTFVVQFFGTPAPVVAVRDPAPVPEPAREASSTPVATPVAEVPVEQDGVVVLGLVENASQDAQLPAEEPSPSTHVTIAHATSSASTTPIVLFSQVESPPLLPAPKVAAGPRVPFLADPWGLLMPLLRSAAILAALALAYLTYIELMEEHRRHAISAGALAIACTVLVISLPTITREARLDSGVTAFVADPSAHFTERQTHQGIAYASDLPHSPARATRASLTASAADGATQLWAELFDGVRFLLSH